MTRIAVSLVAVLLLAPLPSLASKAKSKEGPNLYERVGSKLAADPALAAAIGKPAPAMKELAWLIGRWEVTAEAEGKSEAGVSLVTPVYDGIWLEVRDSYPGGTQDLGYVGYDLANRRWQSLSLDSLGNTSHFGGVHEDNRWVFEGKTEIVGVPTRLRQTVTHLSDDEYTVTNEEHLGGHWVFLDRYHYRRLTTP